MKLLTVDYEPRHARRVTIPVPDDVFTVSRAVEVLKRIKAGGGNA